MRMNSFINLQVLRSLARSVPDVNENTRSRIQAVPGAVEIYSVSFPIKILSAMTGSESAPSSWVPGSHDNNWAAGLAKHDIKAAVQHMSKAVGSALG